jgi:hypothetical protein
MWCRNVDSILVEMMNSCSTLYFILCLAYSLAFSNIWVYWLKTCLSWNLNLVGSKCLIYLSSCLTWYREIDIAMTLFQRNTYHLEISISKLQIKSFSMIKIPTKAIWHIHIQNLSHMLLVFKVSFVKLLWPMLRFFSYTHDQDSRTLYKIKTLSKLFLQKWSERVWAICQRSMSQIKDAIPKGYVPKKREKTMGT